MREKHKTMIDYQFYINDKNRNKLNCIHLGKQTFKHANTDRMSVHGLL